METGQEVYDKIVTHLRTQGEKAITTEGHCSYRIGNLKCAIGCLIQDDEYDESMEGVNFEELISESFLSDRLITLFSKYHNLFVEMQSIHDTLEVKSWEVAFKLAAEHYNLIYTPPVKS